MIFSASFSWLLYTPWNFIEYTHQAKWIFHRGHFDLLGRIIGFLSNYNVISSRVKYWNRNLKGIKSNEFFSVRGIALCVSGWHNASFSSSAVYINTGKQKNYLLSSS